MLSESSFPIPELHRLWGKTDKERGTNAFHPAIYHMLDVGHVARLLLGEGGSARIRGVLARTFDASPDELAAWLPLVVALHDIGKISSQFQKMNSVQRERLLAEGFEFDERPEDQPIAHNILGAAYVQFQFPKFLTGNELTRSLKYVLRDTISGHHGRFTPSGELNDVKTHIDPQTGGNYDSEPAAWNELRGAACKLIADVLVPAEARKAGAPIPGQVGDINVRAATLMLTGFTILCDWIGSDTRYFPLSDHVPLDKYRELSRTRARKALEDIGSFLFEQAARISGYNGFGALFPNIERPRPLQAAVDQLPLSEIGYPALFIVEAPTGEGKTEFALALAQRLAAEMGQQGQSDELYFALPTIATSNQMYLRVSKFIDQAHPNGRNRGSGKVQLVHGQAFLAKDRLNLKLYSDQDRADPEGASAAASQSWFAPKKRALLAPFGVGTVDQTELTTLSTRHYMLRLFGLAGKAVIIDEVHAYDVYMSTILEHVLRWLAVLGTSVILLSATLPSSRHKKLAKAWQEGLLLARAGEDATDGGPSWLDAEDSESDEPSTEDSAKEQASSELPYPLIAAYGPAQSEPFRHSVEASQTERKLYLRFLHLNNDDEMANFLLAQVDGGGAACYVCNTVQGAQDVFHSLLELKPHGVKLKLIHSRFPQEDRLKLEDEIAGLVGPETGRSIGDKIIVVGTQVLEQSLDLDFDVMVSDHAPIDLLLQRAGRLQRHPKRDKEGKRPPAHAKPHLYVHLPVSGEDHRPLFREWKWTYVYSEYILWRSWLTLRKRGLSDTSETVITLPAGYRQLIEDCYSGYAELGNVSPLLADTIGKAHAKHQDDETHLISEAKRRLVPDPKPPNEAIIDDKRTGDNFIEDEEGLTTGWGTAQTRLGEERITVIPLYDVGGRWSLDPRGLVMLGDGLKENRDLQLNALRRSIPVSHKVLVRHLRQMSEQAPAWFREAKLLRYIAPFVLSLDGVASVGDTIVTLDKIFGLEIRKSSKKEENND